MEHVNHPAHYNKHPKGIECIQIIRHYTCDIANAIKYLWRAGLKTELGKEDAEKEIEDLNKALWYIADYRESHIKHAAYATCKAFPDAKAKGITDKEVCIAQVYLVTGYHIRDVVEGYEENIHVALFHLLQVGIINIDGKIYLPRTWRHMLDITTRAIHARILEIGHSMLSKEVEDTCAVLRGQAVDGMDYIAKPACVRETEPEHYDPLNMIVAWGHVYGLSDEPRRKDNGALYSPCDICDLREYCVSNDGTEPLKYICSIHGANGKQYYQQVGSAKYRPFFGTVEVVDEMKELTSKQVDIKRLENDNH